MKIFDVILHSQVWSNSTGFPILYITICNAIALLLQLHNAFSCLILFFLQHCVSYNKFLPLVISYDNVIVKYVKSCKNSEQGVFRSWKTWREKQCRDFHGWLAQQILTMNSMQTCNSVMELQVCMKFMFLNNADKNGSSILFQLPPIHLAKV